MDTKLLDKLLKDWKSISNRLDFYEGIYELNMESGDDFIKSSIEYYRKEQHDIRELLIKQNLNTES